jgi:hypothetical protein
MPGGAEAERAWAAGRAAENGEPGWTQSRQAAEAYACDAAVAPIVTGHLDPGALAAMTADYLAGRSGGQVCPAGDACPHAWHVGSAPEFPVAGAAGFPRPGPGPGSPLLSVASGRRSAGAVLAVPRVGRLEDTLLRWAADLLSGPGGLAAHLRARQLGQDFPAGISLVLDSGAPTRTVPPHLRRAVIARDRHCRFPGCAQRAVFCHVHHLIPRARGGPTALRNLALLCAYHHLVVIHRQGWTLTLHGDGTTTATSPKGRVLHSHSPPAGPG